MGSTASKPGKTRESLYDLLGVRSDADSSALKKAYRQKALELHPDRNYANEEEATAVFAKVQAAYDLLTDPQERAWYDQHRKNRDYKEYDGELTTAAEVRATTAEVLMATTSLGPGSGPGSGSASSTLDFELIAGYFEKLKHEEQEAAFEQGLEQEAAFFFAPSFGSAQDSWTQIRQFYDAWSAFQTVKSYNWEDVYPLHAAQDRRTRRSFEQANKKVRDAAKREFNAAVKQAVFLLRQRDPRKPGETKTKSTQQDQLLAKVQAERAENKKQLRDAYADQDWQKPEDPTAEPEESAETFECVACDTTFETEFDLADHKRTAKHKRLVEAMRAKMLQEDELLNGAQPEQTPTPPQPKLGKAKAKAKRKQKGQHILTCGTCGGEFSGPELMEHKRQTRHP